MKKLYPVAILFLALSACSGPQYDISGRIEALNEGTVLLEQRIDGVYIPVDSSTISDGHFNFQGTVETPDVYYISIPGKRGKAMFFLENSDIKISAHMDSLYLAVVEGSSVQDEYQAFSDELDEIITAVREMYNKYHEALSSGDEVLASSLEEEVDAAYDNINAFQEKFIKDNPASYVAPLVLWNIHYGMEGEEIEAYLKRFDPALASSSFVEGLSKKAELLKTVALGKTAPDFTQNDPEGNPVTLFSLRGNYLLIDFWAAWCGPCRRENPNVVAAYQKFHEKGFDILGVSLDQSKEDWLRAIEYDRLAWTQVSDLKGWGNEAARLYGISSIPSNLLLDREGKIIFKGLRGEDLHTELEKLLSE